MAEKNRKLHLCSTLNGHHQQQTELWAADKRSVARDGTNGLFHTSKHHHVLEVPLDLVPPAEVEEEGEGVNVHRSSNEYGNLTGSSRSL